MASSLIDPQERAHLRDKYKKAVRSIVYELQSRSKPTYTHAELAQFRVSVQSIDPEDHTFTDSEACLFQPLTHEELETFKMDREALPGDEYHYINEFKDTFHDVTGDVPEDCLIWERAGQIAFYIEAIRAENSFNDTPTGMLCGVKTGHSKPRDVPRWTAHSIRQWLDDFKDPKTTRPHIKLVTLTGTKAKENELLHSELASIANTLYCRLEQPEFEHTSFFPAKFDNSGTLLVQSSPIYNFVDSDGKMELFIRYNNCNPRDGLEIEPVLVEEQSPSPRVQHQASPSGLDKENLDPEK
ncbi:uncharacterized protein N7518_002675 [Penicillium psychrosexuale]|uniref:uncharacterized protein n=1 Tax=Penicillium psychrosexuale TaxID=1002107 RepID=UPI00254551A8|nr:uncharacterized protein N7518_002675 [Penicillium psychrosexuale]KAJ5800607.1 hypothetical protein N7518_002675 [Penicillium psychrosexuale]